MQQRKGESREEFNVRANAYMKKRYAEAMVWLQAYKVENGCVDCGWNEHHAGLQIDHLEPRNGDGNQLIARMAVRGINVLKRELAKCDVVCGTHHGIRTWERRQNAKE
jgi:hypothetical protein